MVNQTQIFAHEIIYAQSTQILSQIFECKFMTGLTVRGKLR